MKEKKIKEKVDDNIESKINKFKIISSRHFKDLLNTAEKELEIIIEDFGTDGDIENTESYQEDFEKIKAIKDKLSQYKIFDFVNYDSLEKELDFKNEFITFIIDLINDRLKMQIKNKEKEIFEINKQIENFEEINRTIK